MPNDEVQTLIDRLSLAHERIGEVRERERIIKMLIAENIPMAILHKIFKQTLEGDKSNNPSKE